MPRNPDLSQRLEDKQVATVRRSRRTSKLIEEKADKAAAVAAVQIAAGDPARAVTELDILATGIAGVTLLALREMLRWSWSTTVMAFAEFLPREPLAEMADNPENEPPPEPEPPADDEQNPMGSVVTLTAAAWAAYLASRLFPAPTRRQENAIIYQPVEGIVWNRRLEAWQRLHRFQMAENAPRYLIQLNSGAMTLQQIQAAVRAEFGDFSARAQRIAEHELYRVAMEAQRMQYGRLGPLLEGVIILNPKDERSRPSHYQRSGTVYWADPDRTPNLREMPIVPDAINCRCWSEPVLRQAATAAVAGAA